MAAGGFGKAWQAITSGLLFGLAHAGWGALSGKFDPRALLGSAVATTVLGTILACIYLLSKRSLMPVITSHVVLDLLVEPWLVMAALSGTLGK